MSKVTTTILIVLCPATATACWLVYSIEYRREQRELRERQASEQAALESEMYQAWHHATRYETFKGPLESYLRKVGTPSRKALENDYPLIHTVVVSVKSFQRSDVKFVGKSQNHGYNIFDVGALIIWRTDDLRLFHLLAHTKVEKMDGPGDWACSDWSFSPIQESMDGAYHGDFPTESVMRQQ